jgi:hypothetical protein
MNASKTKNIISPQKPPILDLKTPPRRKEPLPSPPRESPDQSPLNSKKNNQQLPAIPPPATTGATANFDDFFD